MLITMSKISPIINNSKADKSKKRLAVCLFGLAGQVETWKDGRYVANKNFSFIEEVFRLWKYRLKYEGHVDFFIHTWDEHLQQKLQEIYSPKKILAEKQKKFNVWPRLFIELWNMKGISKRIKFLYNIYFSYPKYKQIFWKRRVFAAVSRWYSTGKSIELCQQYATENNVKYDIVISARLDLVLLSKFDIDKLDPNKLNLGFFNRTPSEASGDDYDKSNLTASQDKLSDLMFVSSLQTISQLRNIYENFNSYPLNPHAASYNALTEVTGRDNFHFFFYPWADVTTFKSHFYDWKMSAK